MKMINKQNVYSVLGVFFFFFALPAFSATQINTYPQTAAIDAKLPIIHTSHGSTHLKANVLNPFPVCNALEDRRTVVYKINESWLPVGTISAKNETEMSIPLTQNTSRAQSISFSVNGSRTEKIDVNLGSNGSSKQGDSSIGGQWGIAFSLAQQIGASASYSLSWTVGQNIGPYSVPAGYTGEATYGFRVVNMIGTQQICGSNGLWTTPTMWRAFVPLKSEVRVKLYDNLADSVDKNTHLPNKAIAILPEKPKNPDMRQPGQQLPLDLEPYLTVSSAKAAGFAGSVALRLRNTGSESYYGEFPVVSFLVEVHTESGPKGVDRLITPRWYNGAYVQDLGFDREKSLRRFYVSLSNPIEAGQERLIASFSFNDGNTRAGRLKNFIRVSQIGRVENDKSFYNDQEVDSRKNTLDDFGKQIQGIF